MPSTPVIRTTVDSSIVDASTPQITVPNHVHPNLTLKGEKTPLTPEEPEQEKPARLLYREKGHSERKHLSSLINSGKQCPLQAGYRQRWSLNEMYDAKKHQFPPSIHFSTNQIIRVSFLELPVACFKILKLDQWRKRLLLSYQIDARTSLLKDWVDRT